MALFDQLADANLPMQPPAPSPTIPFYRGACSGRWWTRSAVLRKPTINGPLRTSLFQESNRDSSSNSLPFGHRDTALRPPRFKLGDDVPPVKLTIRPAAAPRPALRYQLLPELKQRIRGNAAVYYGKVTAEHGAIFCRREMLDKIEHWRQAPLADLRKEDVDMGTSLVEAMLTRAARCETCDWQLPIHEEPFFTILLPEVQQTRQFARNLATRARIQIANGRFDEAIKTFQSGFALGEILPKEKLWSTRGRGRVLRPLMRASARICAAARRSEPGTWWSRCYRVH